MSSQSPGEDAWQLISIRQLYPPSRFTLVGKILPKDTTADLDGAGFELELYCVPFLKECRNYQNNKSEVFVLLSICRMGFDWGLQSRKLARPQKTEKRIKNVEQLSRFVEMQ